MVVAVQQPGRQESAVDKLIKGLGIAQSVFGIKSALEQSELRDLQKKQAEMQLKEQERLSSGIMTPLEATKAGLVSAEPGQKGSIPIQIKRGETVQKQFFVPQSQLTAQRQIEKAETLEKRAEKKEESAAQEYVA